MSQPTILQLIPRLNTGGAEKTTVEMTEALSIAGAQSLVATKGGWLATAVEEAGGEIIKFPAETKNPLRMVANIWRLKKLIIERNIDLIHARSRAPAWSALFAAQATGRPFVTTYHGAYGNRGPFKNFYNSVMARGDLVIANSHFTADLITKRHPCFSSGIKVIHRGVDLDAFDPELGDHGKNQQMRKDWGVRGDQKIVLHAARLTGWKGQTVVIKAAGELKRRGKLKNYVFVLAGDAQGRGDYVQKLETLIAQENVADAVKIVGHCGDIITAFAIADLAVVASTEAEAFGRAAAEAQSMGCPVIVSDLGAVRETVRASPDVPRGRITGWRIPAGDSQSLADTLIVAGNLSPVERNALSARARHHILASFSVEKMQYQTLASYDSLMGTHLAPAFVEKTKLREGQSIKENGRN